MAVECIVKKAAWFHGHPVEPGHLVSLSEGDASYAASIGRVERVTAATPAPTAPAAPAAPAVPSAPPASIRKRKPQWPD